MKQTETRNSRLASFAWFWVWRVRVADRLKVGNLEK
ncbi:hypothetical protein BRC2024_OQYPJBKP_CDS_0038 [Acinetobacter phage vB_AbaM_Highwayman]